jgi:hypothetical protein
MKLSPLLTNLGKNVTKLLGCVSLLLFFFGLFIFPVLFSWNFFGDFGGAVLGVSANEVKLDWANVVTSMGKPDWANADPDTNTQEKANGSLGQRPYDVHFVTYADREPYTKTQKLMGESVTKFGGVKHQAEWNEQSFKRAFAISNVSVEYDLAMIGLDGRRCESPALFLTLLREAIKKYCGVGEPYRWMWKPFIIFEQLVKARDGDVVVYADSSKYLRSGFQGSLRLLTNEIAAHELDLIDGIAGVCLPYDMHLVFARYRKHTCVDKTSTFQKLLTIANVSDVTPKRMAAWNRMPMFAGAWMVFRKTERTMQLVRRWLQLMFNLKVLLTVPFYDQDCMGIAAMELNFPCLFLPQVDGFPSYENGNDIKHINPFIQRSDAARTKKSEKWFAVFPDKHPITGLDAMDQMYFSPYPPKCSFCANKKEAQTILDPARNRNLE